MKYKKGELLEVELSYAQVIGEYINFEDGYHKINVIEEFLDSEWFPTEEREELNNICYFIEDENHDDYALSLIHI